MDFGIEEGGGERALFIFGETLDAEGGIVFFTDGFFEREGAACTTAGSGTSTGTTSSGSITGLGGATGDDSMAGVSSTLSEVAGSAVVSSSCCTGTSGEFVSGAKSDVVRESVGGVFARFLARSGPRLVLRSCRPETVFPGS